ncbi:hypothetical protein [uncultured Prevotella sp.]|nr:hypothetical protein [uncultured Prevotella sp.]
MFVEPQVDSLASLTSSFEDVPGFIEHRAYGSVNFSIFSNREPEGEDE